MLAKLSIIILKTYTSIIIKISSLKNDLKGSFVGQEFCELKENIKFFCNELLKIAEFKKIFSEIF